MLASLTSGFGRSFRKPTARLTPAKEALFPKEAPPSRRAGARPSAQCRGSLRVRPYHTDTTDDQAPPDMSVSRSTGG